MPLVAVGWSWPVLDTIGRAEPYRSIATAVGDPYVVFGALGAVSFLTIGLSLLLSLRRAGWGGIALGATVLLGVPVSVLSYLGTDEASPLHGMWGAEIFVLLLIAVAGIPAAVTAASRYPAWVAGLLASTFLVLLAGLGVFQYYPHGCLVMLGIEALVLAAGTRGRARSARQVT